MRSLDSAFWNEFGRIAIRSQELNLCFGIKRCASKLRVFLVRRVLNVRDVLSLMNYDPAKCFLSKRVPSNGGSLICNPKDPKTNISRNSMS